MYFSTIIYSKWLWVHIYNLLTVKFLTQQSKLFLLDTIQHF